MEAEFAGSVGEGSVLDFVAEGTDIVALGATGFDWAAEHSDLGAMAELEAGFVGVLVVPVFCIVLAATFEVWGTHSLRPSS